MGKKRLSRDQKRKAKLAQRARKERAAEPLAYTGNRYKTDELVPLVHMTETAIYECHVLTGRLLTDRHVQAALERLVVGLRAGGLPPLEEGTTLRYTAGR